jgi:hypothetical protein
MIIQIILIISFIVFLFWVLASPNSYKVRAWTKLLTIIFVTAAIVTILFPNSTNRLAHLVGVSRGADLLLYILTLVFIFGMFNSYVSEKRLQKKIVVLARKIAILESNQRNIDSKKK